MCPKAADSPCNVRCGTFVPTSTTGFFPTRSLTRGRKLPEASIRSTNSTATALFSLICSSHANVKISLRKKQPDLLAEHGAQTCACLHAARAVSTICSTLSEERDEGIHT